MKKSTDKGVSQIQDMENINLILLGDRNAFKSIFNKYRAQISYKVYNSANGDKDLANDLVMEIFEKAYFNINKYKEDFTFNSWLSTLAQNHIVDHFRNKKNNSTIPFSKFKSEENSDFNIAESFEDFTQSPQEKESEIQRNYVLNNAVSQLDKISQRIINLRFYEEKSLDEIAIELDLTVTNVKQKFFRDKKVLAKLLENVHNL